MGAAQQIMVVQKIAGGGGFVPTDIAGIQLWLDASQEAFADNDAVGTATDWSGAGHDATQATGAQQPTFKTGIVNSLPVFRFDGTADNIAGIATTSAARTTFIVLRKRSGAIANTDVAFSFANSINAVFFTNSTLATGWAWYNPVATIGGTETAWNIICVKHASAASATPYINGTAGTGFNPDDTYTLSNAYRLGATDSGPSNPSNVDIAEVIVYDSALSDADRDSVESYLGTKYGITVA